MSGTDKEIQLEKLRRSARIARIIDRLERLDDGTLEVLDRMSADALVGMTAKETLPTVNRRQFLGAAAAGGAIVALTGGLTLWQLTAAHTAALEKEADRLRRLVALYEEMDATGLDDLVTRGIGLVESIMGIIQDITLRLSEDIRSARQALLDFQSRFPTLQSNMQWLKNTVSTLSQRLTALENEVSGVLGVASPIAETVGSFLSRVLDRLPGTFGRQVRSGLERMGEVVAMLPSLAQGLYTRILEPMDNWFTLRAGAGLNGRLVNPILYAVLDPAETLIGKIAELTATWNDQLAGPARQALTRREQIRAEIARLKEEIAG